MSDVLRASALAQRKLPHRVRKRSGDFNLGVDAWTPPVEALPGVGRMPTPGEDETEAARVFHMVATQRLVIAIGGNTGFGKVFSQCNHSIQ